MKALGKLLAKIFNFIDARITQISEKYIFKMAALLALKKLEN